jgi:Flavin-binding monooxygenase-like
MLAVGLLIWMWFCHLEFLACQADGKLARKSPKEMAMNQVISGSVTKSPSDALLVEQWLGRFESALQAQDAKRLGDLFADDCHWRDLLALTWNITPHEGRSTIVSGLIAAQKSAQMGSLEIADGHTPPRRVRRAGEAVIESIFSFETVYGRGLGVVRLLESQPEKAWVLMTSLQEIKGHEAPIGSRRPSGAAYSREFGGMNWQDRRNREQAFEDREPAVLIIGAGQTGLSTAARLRMLGVDSLCIDKDPRVGDSWRNRYHSLALHNQVALNQMAYMPFPPHWPKYLAKDMLANWMEHYAWAMECNVWTSTTLLHADYDETEGHWNARVRRADGTERVLKPRQLVFATGVVGAPKIPKLPGLDLFKGQILHTHAYKDGAAWKGKNALVIGAGTSGHDIAQDLYSHGANVKLIQRGPITITSVEAACMAYGTYYDEALPTEECDLLALTASYPLAVRNAKIVTQKMQEFDRKLLEGLAARGFKLDIGEDETGYLLKVRRSHGGYYLNCGCSELIVDGKVGLLHFEDIERFTEDGALMKDGSIEKADLIVAATGYQNQQELVRELLGNDVAEKVGPIWGIDPKDGELRNMYRPTPQKSLWFLGSGLSQARIYSHYVALQIKAREMGLVK